MRIIDGKSSQFRLKFKQLPLAKNNHRGFQNMMAFEYFSVYSSGFQTSESLLATLRIKLSRSHPTTEASKV